MKSDTAAVKIPISILDIFLIFSYISFAEFILINFKFGGGSKLVGPETKITLAHIIQAGKQFHNLVCLKIYLIYI